MNTPTDVFNQNILCPGNFIEARGRFFAAGLLLLAVMMLAGCQTATPMFPQDPYSASLPYSPPPDARTSSYSSNMLSEGDVVSIAFQYSTNFNEVQKVGLDGMLNLQTVGPVKAAGRTITELQTDLARVYKPQVKDDVVTVKVVATSDSVYLSGAVIRPGKIPMERPMTALEAIMEAGGFDPNRANLTDVIVLRLELGKQKSYILNLKRALRGQDEKPFYLKPFDIVHVPTKTFNF